ncbi:bifunctional folylpolyglutamate synthase/dihydrofolate synthase [Fulvivirga ligni]|uniref:bifunctional folylpolyglutamate synthase/dihydrofolate synthase n=1 Tax=Fulvivirga ligni TaxID=2904246 RepID=UPI001F1E462A|nr:folylpolyglutamate synthase/dihydrofolate synthase family protein [Fulvivirga ligni]UII19211.1 bifunctional folylpolyglutamate synthase/dihydrofolate synthase [Fulvivirga ligni]
MSDNKNGKFSSYQEVLDYLFVQLPMFQKQGASAYKKDLDNTIKLLAALDNPERKFKSIHVAGTNGKGSTSHYLSAILQEAGYKTALYTSPHLKNFSERIKLNGQEVSEEYVLEFMNRVVPVLDEVKPSFFEFTVAMAFDFFAKEKVDIAIIEVGMGGRLDSTNVITPEFSLITNIGYDHQQWLGNTLEEIAGEKAGIIKKGVPVIISERQPSINEVFEAKAKQHKAPIVFADDIYEAEFDHEHLVLNAVDEEFPSYSFHLPQAGKYQKKNLAGVLMGVEVLNELGYDIDLDNIITGVEQMKALSGLKGRWQIIDNEPLTICDVGHNEDGVKYIVEQIKQTPHEHLHMVWGTVNDKDISKVLQLLPKEATYYFCQAHIPRALEAASLAQKANEAGLKGEIIPEVSDAIAQARRNAKKDDLIFIGGSTFVVAEIENL